MNPRQAIEQAISNILDYIGSVGIDSIGSQIKESLANLLSQAADRLSELMNDAPSNEVPADGLTPPLPELEQGPYPSSNINSFNYNPKTQRLLVKFHGKDTAESGPIYSYDGVGKNIFDLIASGGVAPKTSGRNKYHQWYKGITPSHGAAVNALLVKGSYTYRRIV